jgi:p24 family protein beta-1
LYVQIEGPRGQDIIRQNAVSSGDHSFEAKEDGRYTYCFGNEHWSANTKEVSFNVHGIVYVPESEVPQDPLEKEGAYCHPRQHIFRRPAQYADPTNAQ